MGVQDRERLGERAICECSMYMICECNMYMGVHKSYEVGL